MPPSLTTMITLINIILVALKQSMCTCISNTTVSTDPHACLVRALDTAADHASYMIISRLHFRVIEESNRCAVWSGLLGLGLVGLARYCASYSAILVKTTSSREKKPSRSISFYMSPYFSFPSLEVDFSAYKNAVRSEWAESNEGKILGLQLPTSRPVRWHAPNMATTTKPNAPDVIPSFVLLALHARLQV